tara:strand:+ start:46 stop:615 length:570 start_codon:yes stop_codon:yes gene_type:complete
MNQNNYLKKYFKKQRDLLNFDEKTINKIILAGKVIKNTNQKRKKNIIFGNGGSSAIASHFSVDLTKNAKVRCVNFNEPDLLTCFSNDFGYEKWVEKSIEYYADKGDTVILISASGNSPNMIFGAKKARKKKCSKIITLTGNQKDNKLSKLGDINFWINSKSYNHIENTHQAILLSIVDLIIGKSVYPSK